MYLKNIKVNGFKSFADKTNIALDNNITCVVGPNGSGKSNIVDAIKWVLGEQSVKSLRGSNNMSDIIFAGSKSRSGASSATVSLTFSNEDKYLNTDFNEIEVKRIIYKNGESEYFINNTRTRLKDITDLFLDTGASLDSFNIISQGNIESVVNSKPLERRIIFESASGVVKYKKRKEESLRKLKSTKENIEKITLIIDELKTTVEPLKEQSDNAKKYLKLKDDLSSIEIATIVDEISIINEDYTKIKQEIEEINKKIVESDNENSKENSYLEQLKLKNIKLDEEIGKENAKLLELTSKFMNLQNEKNMYVERKKYSDGVSFSNDILNLKEEILDSDKMIEVLSNEINNIKSNIKEREKELKNVSEEQSYNKIKRNSLLKNRNENAKELLALKNKKDIVEANLINDTKIPYSVKSILNNIRLEGVIGTIGKLIETQDKYATALDVALAASINFVVVDTPETAEECINYLKNNKLGRVTFFPLNVIKERFIDKETLNKVENKNGYIGILSDLCSYQTKYKNIITNQLGNIIVVKDMNTMTEFGRLINYKYRIVTLDGEIMHAGGSLSGGIYKSNSNLNEKRELANITAKTKELEIKNNNLNKEIDNFDEDIEILNEKEETLLRNIINLKEIEKDKSTILENKKIKLAEINKELEGVIALNDDTIDEKLMNLMNLVSASEKEKILVSNNLEKLKDNKNETINKIAEIEKQYKEKNAIYYKLQNELKNKEVAIGKMDIKLDNLLLVLNETYNLTYEKAHEDYILEIDLVDAKNKVNILKKEINNLGEVNLFAIEEYDRVSTRYNFLIEQINDLNESSKSLESVIDEMDIIMKDKFTKTFNDISKEFSKVFKKLFKGGNGLLRLTEPDNILETGIDIIAEPPGKKLNSIGLLSGGEKTLTAISLLFAIMNVKTIPFCILDEVEAALDEANVDAFGKYLQEQKKHSQFILITHKKRTMEYADTLYGITMQESGVSKIVSVSLENV